MRKIRLVFVMLAIILMLLVGCDQRKQHDDATNDEFFVSVPGCGFEAWTIVYHKNTKVMYAVSNGLYSNGIFTLLVDDEGKTLLWQED